MENPKKDIDINEAEKAIQKQLTIRAAVWDIPVAGGKGPAVDGRVYADYEEVSRLMREMERYQVKKLDISGREKEGSCQDAYEKILCRLREQGIMEEQAVLVTADERLSGYVYSLRQQYTDAGSSGAEIPHGMSSGKEIPHGVSSGAEIPHGMAAVFYEKDGYQKAAAADIIVQGFQETGIQFLDRIQKRRNGIPWNILYTKRACVRETALSDLDELYALYEGEGITDYTEPLFEREAEEAYTKDYIRCMYYYYGYGMWVVRERQTDRLIGRAGLGHREQGNEVLAELGYLIGKEYQNQGYAQEVCRAIVEYARDELEITQLHCFIHSRNAVSIHVAEKLGFTLCGDGACPDGQEKMLHYSCSLSELSPDCLESKKE